MVRGRTGRGGGKEGWLDGEIGGDGVVGRGGRGEEVGRGG